MTTRASTTRTKERRSANKEATTIKKAGKRISGGGFTTYSTVGGKGRMQDQESADSLVYRGEWKGRRVQ